MATIPRWHDHVVWITGASSGIGRALAARLAWEGARVYASARNAAALASLAEELRVAGVPAPGAVLPLPLDVTDRDQILAAAARIRAEAGRLDVLVANAGDCEYIDVQRFDSAPFARMFAVNFHGVVHCVEAALPLLRAGGTRYILGVGSSAAFTGLPRAEAYGASKAALHYFLDSLRIDLAGEGFAVSVAAPGFVDTPLTGRNDFPMPMRIDTARAVEYLLAGMRRRRPEIDFPLAFTRVLRLLRLLPAGWRMRLGQRLVRREALPS